MKERIGKLEELFQKIATNVEQISSDVKVIKRKQTLL